mmetsp:Transcript_4363/g.10536  ORF Transcript_4363/g.10536 Transcript_4363/m.10536 type:complete len:514 (+) Transcript_4363:59-1600(+)
MVALAILIWSRCVFMTLWMHLLLVALARGSEEANTSAALLDAPFVMVSGAGGVIPGWDGGQVNGMYRWQRSLRGTLHALVSPDDNSVVLATWRSEVAYLTRDPDSYYEWLYVMRDVQTGEYVWRISRATGGGWDPGYVYEHRQPRTVLDLSVMPQFTPFPGRAYLPGPSLEFIWSTTTAPSAVTSTVTNTMTSTADFLQGRAATHRMASGGNAAGIWLLGVGVALLACSCALVSYSWRRRWSPAPPQQGQVLPQAPGVRKLPVLLGSLAEEAGSKPADIHQSVDPAWASISFDQFVDLRRRVMEALGTEYWTATMHDVNSKFLQPLCDGSGMCYAHFINSSELLLVDVFVSHAWQECFEEFFQAVCSAFRHWRAKPNLWICALALRQSKDAASVALQVGAGSDPSAAPFTKALAKADKLLIVRNSAVNLYDRIWCCWEFYMAVQLGFCTRPGAVLVSGPNVFQEKCIDIACAKASSFEDKQKILAHIFSNGSSYQFVNKQLETIAEFSFELPS